MLAQVIQRCARRPEEYLVDGGFVTLDDVERVTQAGVTLYAPIRAPRGSSRDRTTPRWDGPPAVADWRLRMGTEEAKAIYRQRAATSECVNAQLRQRHDLYQFAVRGLVKVTAVATLMVIVHNLLRWTVLTS